MDNLVISRLRPLVVFCCKDRFIGLFTDFLENFIQALGIKAGYVGFFRFGGFSFFQYLGQIGKYIIHHFHYHLFEA